MRQFRRLHLRRRAQKVVPPDFKARIIAAHHAHPWTGYSDASIVHDRSCAIRRGKSCTCQPKFLSPCRTVRLSKLTQLAVANWQRASDGLLCGERKRETTMSEPLILLAVSSREVHLKGNIRAHIG
jgi:hypothetical protein